MTTQITNIKLDHIKIDEFAILESITPREKNVGYRSNFEYSLNEEDYLLGSTIDVELVQDEKTFIKLKATIIFEIRKEDFDTYRVEKNVIIPKSFLKALTDISFNIVRGILFSKLEQTDYRRFIIPLVDLSPIINEDEIFEL